MCATRIIAGALLVSALLMDSAGAKDKTAYATGVLAEMQSVSCGYMQKSGPTVAGALITGAEHSKSRELLCQEYTLKTDRVTYRIRPKEEKHPALLPVGEEAQFRLKKDQLLLRIPELDNKEREYIVVSMAPTAELANEIESTRRPPKPHGKALKVDDSGGTDQGRNTPTVNGGMVDAQARVAQATPSANAGERPGTTEASSGGASPLPVSGAGTTQQASGSGVDSRANGSLQVQSNPAGAEVYVDSTLAGRTPALVTLKPGPHSIQVVMGGYKDWVTNVNVAAGTEQQVTINLSR